MGNKGDAGDVKLYLHHSQVSVSGLGDVVVASEFHSLWAGIVAGGAV